MARPFAGAKRPQRAPSNDKAPGRPVSPPFAHQGAATRVDVTVLTFDPNPGSGTLVSSGPQNEADLESLEDAPSIGSADSNEWTTPDLIGLPRIETEGEAMSEQQDVVVSDVHFDDARIDEVPATAEYVESDADDDERAQAVWEVSLGDNRDDALTESAPEHQRDCCAGPAETEEGIAQMSAADEDETDDEGEEEAEALMESNADLDLPSQPNYQTDAAEGDPAYDSSTDAEFDILATIEPVALISEFMEQTESDPARTRIAETLERLASRIRSGEIPLGHSANVGSETAVLASVLTTLLSEAL
jgi:hypothetical protein